MSQFIYRKWLGTRRSCLGTTDTTIVSPSSRYSGHDHRVRCTCYYETRPFLLLAHKRPSPFLANVNSRSRSLYAIARPSVYRLSVCNVRAPYSGGSDFRQYFYGIRYLGHPLTSTKNFTEIVPGEPLRRGS